MTHLPRPEGHDQISRQLSVLARSLQATEDVGDLLDRVVAAAVQVVPGAQEASISAVTARRRVVSEHPTGDLPRRVDAIQTELGEGPCLAAVFESRVVSVPDVGREQRWPGFAPRASAAGAGSMLSLRLHVQGDDLGSLNLYSAVPHAFDEESEQVGLVLVSHAAVAYASAKKIRGLREAVDSRDLIGQAKGILAERYGLGGDVAFQLLVRVSQSTHRRLRDVAHELVTTRHVAALDPDPAHSRPDRRRGRWEDDRMSTPTEDAGERAKAARRRADELGERLRRLRSGEPVTQDDADRAEQAAHEQEGRSADAHRHAAEAHDEAAARHQQAAELLEAAGHRERAAQHERMAETDEEAAHADRVKAHHDEQD